MWIRSDVEVVRLTKTCQHVCFCFCFEQKKKHWIFMWTSEWSQFTSLTEAECNLRSLFWIQSMFWVTCGNILLTCDVAWLIYACFWKSMSLGRKINLALVDVKECNDRWRVWSFIENQINLRILNVLTSNLMVCHIT